MDNNNWRLSIPNGESAAMNSGEWRKQLPPDSRQKIVNKMYVYLIFNIINWCCCNVMSLQNVSSEIHGVTLL